MRKGAFDDYPCRAIDFYMSFPATGSSARVAEILISGVAKDLGQELVIKDFKPGHGGNLGAEAAARTAPDGYSILMGTIGNMALIPNILKDYKIRPLRDFIPIVQITKTPDILIAHPSLQVSSFEELIEYAGDNPAGIRYSPIEPYSIHRIEFEQIMEKTGVQMSWARDILGSAAAMKALANGDIHITMSTAPYTLPLVEQGLVKPLAVSSEMRMPQLPEVPALKEFGIDARGSWMGVFIPSGAEDAVVSRLFRTFKKAAESPENRKQIEELGVWIHTSESPAGFREFVVRETGRLREAAQRAGILV